MSAGGRQFEDWSADYRVFSESRFDTRKVFEAVRAEVAPTPVTTFLAVCSKVAGFGLILRFVNDVYILPGQSVAEWGGEIAFFIGMLSAVNASPNSCAQNARNVSILSA